MLFPFLVETPKSRGPRFENKTVACCTTSRFYIPKQNFTLWMRTMTFGQFGSCAETNVHTNGTDEKTGDATFKVEAK